MCEGSTDLISVVEYQQVIEQFKNASLSSTQIKQKTSKTTNPNQTTRSSKRKSFDCYREAIIKSCVERFSPPLISTLHYSSLGTYYDKSTLATFLSDILDNPNHIIHSDEYHIIWNEGQDTKNLRFSVMFSLNSPVLAMLSSDVTKNFESHPFILGQSFFLFNDQENPWCGSISEIDVDETSRFVTLEISVYRWIKHPLPRIAHNDSLYLLIASVQATRILNALDNFSRTIFVDLILGNESLNSDSPDTPYLFTNKKLNSSQIAAITAALNNKITIIRGPPGT
ncbi:hypothetical protein G210_3826, partial [Candida maltosa Xu316]